MNQQSNEQILKSILWDEGRTDERVRFLSDVLCTALEGGIGYWCKAGNIVRVGPDDDWRYDSFDAYDDENFDRKAPKRSYLGHVNLDTVETGLRFMRLASLSVNNTIRKSCLLADVMNDAGEIDAEAADCIVQAGLFGEIVYG